METSSIWKERRIFISSTFRDMNAERDHLRNHVFPILEERLKERFHHLTPVDLRWGVQPPSEAGQEEKDLIILKVCLDEIHESRPFLVGLLGDRYGWDPPLERIRAAAEAHDFEFNVDGGSVTHFEIEYGVLTSPEQGRRSRFYFREPLPYDSMDDETKKQYRDTDPATPEGHARLQKLEALKARITATMEGLGAPERVRSYTATWDRENNCVTGLDEWGKQVLEDLWQDIDEETRAFIHAEAVTWQLQERFALDEFIEMGCRDFRGREVFLESVVSFAMSPEAPDAKWGMCITGASGSGKSAVFSLLCRSLQEKAFVLSHAAGISARSTEVDSLLRRWIEELSRFL